MVELDLIIYSIVFKSVDSANVVLCLTVPSVLTANATKQGTFKDAYSKRDTGGKRGEEEEGNGLRGGHVQSALPNSRNGLM